jgi:signal transduction histidine kinase
MDSAYYYFNECLKLDIKIGNKKQIADTYSNLSQFFLMKKDYKTAEKHAKTSIVLLKTIDGKPNLAKSYDILSEIYTSQNQYQKAFEVQKERMANYKLMLQDREASASAEYKIVYETQKKEAKIKVLELENRVRNLKIEQQELQVKRSNYMLILFGLLLLFVLVVSYFWLQHQKLKSMLVREKVIKETEEVERIRMAKDIHDDLGSDLSKINFLSELISQQSKEFPDIFHSTESIKETAKKMIDNMRDLIWALNPENATLANLIARMREHTNDYLEDYPITIDYTIPDNFLQITVANEVHRALFLVVKEAIHNIAKHAKANKINFTLALTADELKCSIQDNGIGFISSNNKGNGLINMKSRIQEIGGTLSVNTKLKEGTEVVFEIKLNTIFKK